MRMLKKVMQGGFPKTVTANSIGETWSWFYKIKMGREAENVLKAAEDQSLGTNCVKAGMK